MLLACVHYNVTPANVYTSKLYISCQCSQEVNAAGSSREAAQTRVKLSSLKQSQAEGG